MSGAEIVSPFQCDYGYQISVGARTFINFGAVILDSAKVTIGDDVQIGPNVQLVTPTHPLDPAQRRTGLEFSAPITIGDGAWLATGVIVCPGVTIGPDCVVGAGSVVTKDLPGGHLCLAALPSGPPDPLTPRARSRDPACRIRRRPGRVCEHPRCHTRARGRDVTT